MKFVLLLIIVGVFVFLYMRKNNEKDNKTMTEDTNQTHSEAETEQVADAEPVKVAEPEVASTQNTVDENEHLAVVEETLEVAEPEPVQAEASSVQLDWANTNLTKALELQNTASNAEETYSAITAAISECYKQRKSQQYLIYGYSLASEYEKAFEQYLAYRSENKIESVIKGTAFMQLATLAQDNGNFEQAIEVCNKAIDHELTDGTVTGFAGRIKRIEKAKEKASA
ncbi:hypothetical protein JQC92_04005 [Shewanella sp. 202IG2-18]|uniref:hypothetical protein n=1 Tax=Parashewanella hymeniacidonis TaxID=2807618 RepID=UPI0019617291|nr:hypothetical protein [Parashewanella hymeniacidonis]MBM7071206.1 hypothetical protein [Parashewanella hymeniacidonis]